MTSIYQRKNNTKYTTFGIILAIFLVPQYVFSSGLSLSVTPTLFEMAAEPLQAWTSSVKVINNNPQTLTVYASVVNFAPKGENGHGKFLPIFEEFSEGKTLAEWMTVSKEPFVIPPESGMSIPLTINVPEDASPGGHFAAIMIGTKPLLTDSALKIQTAQVVTSLFFVRVAGDIVEKGSVRTFRAHDSFVDSPEVDFEVRFENKGNVHLLPQGEIVITNMWGKERGIVPVNNQTHFGNVLPNSIRKFDFTWRGEQSLTDIGRYKAVLTLAYGTDARQFSTLVSHFWVVPIKSVLLVLGSFVAILWLLSWSIRTYVRRMLNIASMQGYVPPSARGLHAGDVVVPSGTSVVAPLLGGFTDFKSRFSKAPAVLEILKIAFGFVLAYKKFFGGLLLLLISFIAVWSFVADVTTQQRDYEVIIDNYDTPVTVSSEEIIYEKSIVAETVSPEIETEAETMQELTQQEYELVLINSSDTVGMAAALQTELELDGYSVAALKSDFSDSKKRTVIVYDIQLQAEALELSKILNGALLSARPTSADNLQTNISIFIGNEFVTNSEE